VNQTELEAKIASGETIATLVEAAAQRMVRVPLEWDWQTEGGECECGLLMARLPHPVWVERQVVTFGRAMPVRYHLTHAHAADTTGAPLCAECADVKPGHRCPEHLGLMCDTPTVVLCNVCADEAALPGGDHCRACAPYEPEWDKDRYLGW